MRSMIVKPVIQVVAFFCVLSSAFIIPPKSTTTNAAHNVTSVAGTTGPQDLSIWFSAPCEGCFIGTNDGVEFNLRLVSTPNECSDEPAFLNGIPLLSSPEGVSEGELTFPIALSNGLGKRQVAVVWRSRCLEQRATLLSVKINHIGTHGPPKEASGFSMSFSQQGQPRIIRLQDKPIQDISDARSTELWLDATNQPEIVALPLRPEITHHQLPPATAEVLSEEFRKLDDLKAHIGALHHQLHHQEKRIMDILMQEAKACSTISCYLSSSFKKVPEIAQLVASHFCHRSKNGRTTSSLDSNDESMFPMQPEEFVGSDMHDEVDWNEVSDPQWSSPNAGSPSVEQASATQSRSLPESPVETSKGFKHRPDSPPASPPPPTHGHDSPPPDHPHGHPHGHHPPPDGPDFDHPPPPGPPHHGQPPPHGHHPPPDGPESDHPPPSPPFDFDGPPHHHHPPGFRQWTPHARLHRILFLILGILVFAAMVGAIVFCYMKRNNYIFRDPRRKVERAARREERRNRAMYRRAACRHNWSQWWNRYRRPTSTGDYEEKRQMILEQEGVLEGVMQNEISSIRAAQELVGEMVRAEESRALLYQRANAGLSTHSQSSPAEFDGSIGSGHLLRTDTLPAYSAPPPTYEEELASELTVVDGFRYTPSNTDDTPDSSVIDCSPRMSTETGRTGISKGAM